MALAAYLDESGATVGDPALVVSGLVSEESLWLEFSERWQTALDKWGISHFHMADYEARREQFEDWPRDEESRRRLGHLLQLILDYSLGRVSVAFPRRLMHEGFVPAPKTEERLYLMTAASAILQLTYFPKEMFPGGKIRLVFEAGAKGRHQVQQAWDELSHDVRNGVSLLSLTFGGKTEFQPLQAADIVAYEDFRQYPKNYGTDARPVRYPLMALSHLPRAGGVITKEFLASIWAMFS